MFPIELWVCTITTFDHTSIRLFWSSRFFEPILKTQFQFRRTMCVHSEHLFEWISILPHLADRYCSFILFSADAGEFFLMLKDSLLDEICPMAMGTNVTTDGNTYDIDLHSKMIDFWDMFASGKYELLQEWELIPESGPNICVFVRPPGNNVGGVIFAIICYIFI